MALLGGYLLIFLARVIDVSCATVRTLMIVKGNKLQAALIGFFEVIIYITALNQVIGTLDKPLNLIVYALGFAAGNYVGSFVEEKLALGLMTVQVVTENIGLSKHIRDNGFGVTVLEGRGKEGFRQLLIISLSRRDLPRLMKLIDELDKDVFVTVLDTKVSRGGYFKQPQKAK
ncbi:MAG: DUF2179 domain-containing protein [Thermoanaerobacterales bacterium]|nr:DUF2179 domain-containing protein [Thermoanaerobacterales bacterium]